MKFLINTELIKMYKTSGKNLNYMLDYLLRTIDPENCNMYFNLFDKLLIDGLQGEVDISEDNIKYIKALFGGVNESLIVKLLWVALLLQEV